MGRDPARDAYRVETDGGIAGWVPEALMRADQSRPGHDDAYRWIDRNAARIERALMKKAGGERVAAPFDRLDLAEE